VEEGRVWLWRATVAFALVLLATGVWLSFFYRPDAPGTPDGVQFVRGVHRLSSVVVVPLSLVTAVVHVLARRRSWPAATGLVLLMAALAFTGYLLPWDQLALWAVTIGTNFRGLVTAAFDDQVKFVLVGSREVSQATIRNWFIVHAAVLPVALAVCLAALRRRSSTVAPTGV
jgi:quinol-cytochrome oxidoreductase complex cytochrome b subunit